MNKLITIVFISFMMSSTFFINEVRANAENKLSYFEIRADGLACPYCAYGIEKKFMAIEGVKNIDVDLEKGLVKVNGSANLNFDEQQLKTLFTDAGFTYRSMKKIEK